MKNMPVHLRNWMAPEESPVLQFVIPDPDRGSRQKERYTAWIPACAGMTKGLTRLFLSLCLVLVLTLVLPACGQASGEEVVLRATHELGVPLHQEAGGEGGYERVAEGTVATVVETARDGAWLRVELADGREGWISRRYVGEEQAEPDDLLNPAFSAEAAVWRSPESCRRLVRSGARIAPNGEDVVRVGTWNIRWFPRGCSSAQECPEQTTNVPWLACAITWMDVDVLAVQEILGTQEIPDTLEVLDTLSAQYQMAELIAQLNRLSDGDWQVDLQDCGGEGSQHVGFLWNQEAVTLSAFADVPALNGASSDSTACAGNLRPGRYARAESPGGVDFHVLSVHLDSGQRNRDYQHRRTAARRIPNLRVGEESLLRTDEDVVILGDFNTMGRSEGSDVTAAQEAGLLDREIGPAFRRVAMSPNCTEYYDGRAGALDFALVSTGMEEAVQEADVTGYCAVARCAALSGDEPLAAQQLSDHCPVLLDLKNEDLDPED